jgi:hypothetical protein
MFTKDLEVSLMAAQREAKNRRHEFMRGAYSLCLAQQ